MLIKCELKLHSAVEFYVLNHNVYARDKDRSIMNR